MPLFNASCGAVALTRAAPVGRGIAEQVKTDAAAIHAAPVTTPVGRPDEVTAARKPIVKYEPETV